MLNQLIYRDIANGSGSGYDEDILPEPPPILPGYDDYDENGDSGYEVVPDELLHSSGGRLIYSSNLILWAQWSFSMGTKNLFPKAILNGKEVCSQHSPSHVVAYKITKTSGSVTVKLSLKSSGKDCEWDASAECTYRLWGGGKNDSGGTHSASKRGTCGGGASFRVTINSKTSDYTITAV